jgi:hypothetical protein
VAAEQAAVAVHERLQNLHTYRTAKRSQSEDNIWNLYM